MKNIAYVGSFNSGKTTKLLQFIEDNKQQTKIFLVCDPAFEHQEKSLGVAVCKKYSNNTILLDDSLWDIQAILKRVANSQKLPLFLVCDLSFFVEQSHNVTDINEKKKIRSFYQIDFSVTLLQLLEFVLYSRLTCTIITDEVEWDLKSIHILRKLNKLNCFCIAGIHPPVYENDKTIYTHFTKYFLNTLA